MSKLDDWQAQIEEIDKARDAVALVSDKHNRDAYIDALQYESELDNAMGWEAIARQALKIALAAEAAAEFMPLDVGEYYATELEVDTANDLRYALKEIES